jgi:hypothetical protein
MIKVIGLLVVSLSSLAVLITLENASSHAIGLSPNSQEHQSNAVPSNLSVETSGATVLVTVTQNDRPINPTGGNGFGSFTGLGAAPAGLSAPVIRVPDSASSGPLLLGSIILGLDMRTMIRSRSHQVPTVNI